MEEKKKSDPVVRRVTDRRWNEMMNSEDAVRAIPS